MVSGAGAGTGVLPGVASVVGEGAGGVVVGAGVGDTDAFAVSTGVAVAATHSGCVGGCCYLGAGAGCALQEARRIEEPEASTAKRLMSPPHELQRNGLR